MEEGFEIKGEKYISSKRASEITGYAKDYVGQLARGKKITAKLIGRNWFVSESSLREHCFGSSQENNVPKLSAQEEISSHAGISDLSAKNNIAVTQFLPKKPPKVHFHDIHPRFYPGQVLFFNDSGPLFPLLKEKFPSTQSIQHDENVSVLETQPSSTLVSGKNSENRQKITSHKAADREEKEIYTEKESSFRPIMALSASVTMVILAVGVGLLLVGTSKVTQISTSIGGGERSISYLINFY